MNETIKLSEEYLASRNIPIEDSQFLRQHVREEQLQSKIGFDPRDTHGERLGADWQPGDTVWSVSRKRLRAKLQALLNPDTYSLTTYNDIKRYAALHKLEVYATSLMLTLPLLFALPFMVPKFKRIKREFLLNQFMKRRFYEQQLKVPGRRISLSQMESIVAEAYRSHNI